MSEPILTPHRLLASRGMTRADIRAMERDGDLTRVRRGVYRSGTDDGLDDRRHDLLVRATWSQLAEGAVVSHLSAAVLHGLPLLGAAPQRVLVTRAEGGHGRADTVLHLRRCSIGADEVVVLDGVRVTSLARTVVDASRSASFDQGVVLADAALGMGLDRLELADCLDRARLRPGVARARRVAAFADARSGSPGESISRVRLQQAGLPAPVLQYELTDEEGRTVITDFAWPELRTVGEFDGKVKYGRLVRPGRTAADVVMAEKSRENRIRRHGVWLVRWGWDDLTDVDAFGRMIRQAFDNAPTYLAAG